MIADKITTHACGKVEKYLIKITGEDDTKFILDKLGRGTSFLNSICLLPIWFYRSFNCKKEDFDFDLLAEANLKAWIGYTLYDYLRDGKIPKSKIVRMISIANICSQAAIADFLSQADSLLKKQQIVKLCNKIDLFYIKQNDSKDHDFKSLCSIIHEKSIAAAISAIIVIPKSKYLESVPNALSFFRYYFTARQLSDDLDDYSKDLRLKITTPVTLIFQSKIRGKQLNTHIRREIDFNFKNALGHLSKIKKFDHEMFIKKYVKPC